MSLSRRNILGNGAAAIATLGASSCAASPPLAINDAAFVTLGGIGQWVTIRGEKAESPVLLIVGGLGADGPGAVLTPFIKDLAPLERDYVLVRYDQRGAGKTYRQAGEAVGPDLTIPRLVADGHELTALLRARFGGRKLLLMGIEFGSTVAALMALERPADYFAYVPAAQIAHHRPDRQRATWRLLWSFAEAAGDQVSLADLRASGETPFVAPRDPAKIAAFVRVTTKYRAPIPENQRMDVLTAPHWSLADALAIEKGMAASETRLGAWWGDAFDFSTLGPRFEIPVTMVHAERAFDAPLILARQWFDGLQSPAKAIEVIAGAGNHGLQTHAAAYLAAINRIARPFAMS